jgi:hypothetical protein
VLNIQLPTRLKTKKEKILEKMNEIKALPSWLKLVQEKANKLGISLDSAIYNDALWEVERAINSSKNP